MSEPGHSRCSDWQEELETRTSTGPLVNCHTRHWSRTREQRPSRCRGIGSSTQSATKNRALSLVQGLPRTSPRMQAYAAVSPPGSVFSATSFSSLSNASTPRQTEVQHSPTGGMRPKAPSPAFKERSYQEISSSSGTASRCLSRVSTGSRCCMAIAATQTSLAGIGRPERFSDVRRTA